VTSAADPFVTVAVCTRDRPEQLEAFLQSACSLALPPELQWELVVVDNGSDDASAAVAERFASLLPLRRVREPAAGISNARNCAVRAARGDYICWADDDTILDRDWLSAYLAAFRRHPDAAVFGGRILPRLKGPTPRWVRNSLQCEQLGCMFGRRDVRDAGAIAANRDDAPWGSNFAVRTLDQRQFEFDPALGYSPEHNRTGEESDLVYRLVAAGAVGWWVPDSVVHHVIPAHRQTWSYLYSYFIRAGETSAYLHARTADRDERGQKLFRMSRGRLRFNFGLRWALFLAASAAGLSTLRVRFLAGAGIYRGILKYRAQSQRSRSRIRRTVAVAGQEVG
jgi:glycosyltransferase involved in cell wall biosynthesis